MPDPLMEPLEPYEPQTASYDWDPEEEVAEEKSNVLWGRIAFFGASLLIAFVIGRMSAPDGAPASDLAAARTQVTELENENEELQTQLADAQDALAAASDPTAEESADPSTDTTTDTTTDEDPTFTGEEYTVQSGDSLNSIAEDFYGDTVYGDYLAEVNNITDPSTLSVGTTLIIPDESELPDKSEL
jgi:nucleoid-associated protein YgaU